jgi:uncharacterized protein
MKLNEGRPGASQLIRRYGAEGVTIGAESHALPLLIDANGVDTSFEARTLAGLTPADLQRIFDRRPALVLAGSAGSRWHPAATVRHAFESQRIALESMDLGAACRTFNVLLQEDREVVALLFPS